MNSSEVVGGISLLELVREDTWVVRLELHPGSRCWGRESRSERGDERVAVAL